ncbi:MAG: C-type lectin domain-containing protein [Polyangiales bacterium]
MLSACDVYDSELIERSSPTVTTHAGADDPADEQLNRLDAGSGGAPTCDCSHVEHAAAVCRNGACLIGHCDDSYRDCDGTADNGCEVAPDELGHCGMCGRLCELPHATTACQSGECKLVACADGWGDCDPEAAGCETRLDSLSHCGACDATCPNSCINGECRALECTDAPGHGDCDRDGESCETDLRSEVEHCGRCNKQCKFAVDAPHAVLSCEDGSCHPLCDEGYGDCDGDATTGCELSLDTAARCGDCHTRCAFPHALAACLGDPGALRCGFRACAPLYADCDDEQENGCERDVRLPALGGQGPCLPHSSCQRVPLGDRDYYFCTAARSWDDARATCRSQLRGDLAQIRNAEVRNFIRQRAGALVWVGHNDQAHEGLWVWSRGGVPFWQGVAADGLPYRGGYASWATGQPEGTSDCGALMTDGAMDERNCAERLDFVCEVIPDGCADDPDKDQPDQCGCGVADTDRDDDGIADCNQGS